MSQYIKDLVSVIMPTYKRSEKLIRAIDSVLNQTYVDIELLVVNDNDPNDGFTAQLIQKLEPYRDNPRFRLIMQQKHVNGAVARNVGIKHARGEYIAFLDDDDWWVNTKIEQQIAALRELDSSWGVVSCCISQYDGDELIAVLPKFSDGHVYKDVLMLKCDFATGTLVFRHSALDEAGTFDENLLRHQDYQLLVDFTSKFKLYQLEEHLHCCDVSDTLNRPDPYKLIEHKKRYFESVQDVIATMSKREQKCVFAIHQFEIGYCFLKKGNVFKAIQYCCKVLRSVDAMKIACSKVREKIKGRTK